MRARHGRRVRRPAITRLPAVGRDSVALAPAYVVPGLASLLTIPLLFGALGATQYGVFILIVAVANGVPQLTTSWLEAVVVRFAHRSEPGTGRRALVTAIGISTILGALLSTVLIPSSDLAVTIAGLSLTGTVAAYLLVTARLQSDLRFGAVSRGAIVRALGSSAAAVALGAMTGSAAAAALGMAVGFGGSALLMATGSRPRPSSSAAPSPRRAAAVVSPGTPASSRDVTTYGQASLVLAGSLYLLSNADRFVLTAFIPLAEVGIYAATYGVVDLLLRLIPSVLLVVIRPRVFRAWDAGDRGRAVRSSMTAMALVGCISTALSIVLILVATSSSILPIDPPQAGLIAAGLAAFVSASALGIVYGAGLRQARVAAHLAIAAIINIALNVFLVPRLGGYGAAAATLISYTVLLGLNIWGLRAEVGVSRIALLVGVGSLGATILHGLVAGTPAWPILAGASTVGIVGLGLGLAAVLARDVRRGPVARVATSGHSAGSPEERELS